MGFWIPAKAGMTVMQRSPFAGKTEWEKSIREGDEIPRE